MARLKKGIFDAPDGKVGNVVFTSRNGVPYVRSMPGKYRDAKTPAQQAARARLTLLTKLLSDLKPAVRIGFSDPPPGKSSRDMAYKANYPVAIKGTWPDLYVDYPSVIVSQGPLEPATGASVSIDGQTLTCEWEPGGSRGVNDRAMITLYNAEKGELITEPFSARRRDGKADITLPDWFPTSQGFHTWLSFMSADGKKVSDSVYVRREM